MQKCVLVKIDEFLLKVDGNKIRQWCNGAVILTNNSLYSLRVILYLKKIFKVIVMKEHWMNKWPINKGQKQTFR